jgi:hypothetical protein
MTVEGVNPVPVIVTVVAALPASTVEGAIELIIGITGGGAEVEDPELPLEQPETRHDKETQIAAIHPPICLASKRILASEYDVCHKFFAMKIT